LDFTPTAISWAADGTRLAISGDSVGRLVVWEVWSPAKPRALVGHPNKIVALSFSPTIPMVLTYGWDSMANFWEPISGRRLLAENRVPVFRFSADGSKVLTAIDDGWREAVQPFLAPNGFRTVASTGKAAEPTEGVWLHPRGQLLAAAYHASKGVRLYRFPHGGEIAGLPGYWAQFTRDGNALLTFARDAVRRYEIPVEFSGCGTDAEWRERVIYRPGAGREISKGTVGPDDKTLVIGEGDCAVLFDLAGERELGRFKEYAQNGSLSANGQWLATSIHQAAGGLLKVSTGEKLLPIPPRSWAEFSPDGRYLLVLDGRALRFYKTNTWERVRRIPLEVGAGTSPGVCFAPDGQMLAVAYNRQEVRLYETASGRELATLSPPNPVPIAGGAGLAFSSDARWLIAARNDGDIVAWELPVIRTELAKLGLDWGNKDLKTPTAVIASIPAIRFPSPQTAAFLAALFAIGAGTFIFLMQRRMIAGYERVEAITLAQREKLETAQDELVHGQKMRALGTLAAGIAHDFNNLLSVIRLSNQLAAEETKPTGAARENMEAVESAVAQGETIVQSMLGYSRAAGETDKEYSVAAALSETVAMLGKKFLSGIVLKLEVAPDLPLVQGARGRLEQMLLNLVVNAAEAMKGHGTLRLAAQTVSSYADCVLKPRPATSYIEVLVSDSGPGIPEEILPRIFEPFFTTKNAGATPGTGLGLSTVYAMAEQDGLGLGVETSQHGTTFRIVIPVGATSPVIGDRIQHNIGI
jgi:signal transduction histidine kinase